jgi:DNA gyrase subunit B
MAQEHYMRFAHGDPVDIRSLVVGAEAGRQRHAKRGTEVTFLAFDGRTFTMIEFDFATLEHRLRELAFLNSGVPSCSPICAHAWRRSARSCITRGGLEAFVRLSRPHQDAADCTQPVDHQAASATARRRRKCALLVERRLSREVLCFTNNIPQRDGGTHLAGFRGALTRQVTSYAESGGIAQEGEGRAHRRRLPRRTDCVLSVKVPDPKFSSQTKDKLVSSEVRPVVEGVVNEHAGAWFEEHPSEAKRDRRQGDPRLQPRVKRRARRAS